MHQKAVQNFVKSLVGYSLITYLLQVSMCTVLSIYPSTYLSNHLSFYPTLYGHDHLNLLLHPEFCDPSVYASASFIYSNLFDFDEYI